MLPVCYQNTPYEDDAGRHPIAPPVINSRPGGCTAFAVELASVHEHGMSFEPQTATARTAASFSVWVRP